MRVVCHNCKGSGMVHGGYHKRIRHKINFYNSQRVDELKRIKPEQKALKKSIDEKYDRLIKEASEENMCSAYCLYCKGKGFRFK